MRWADSSQEGDQEGGGGRPAPLLQGAWVGLPRPHGCVRPGTPGPRGGLCSQVWQQQVGPGVQPPAGPEQALGRDCPGRNLPEGSGWKGALGLCVVDVSSSLCLLAVLGRPLTCLISAEPTGQFVAHPGTRGVVASGAGRRAAWRGRAQSRPRARSTRQPGVGGGAGPALRVWGVAGARPQAGLWVGRGRLPRGLPGRSAEPLSRTGQV